jgi:hypothetical protein
MDNENHRQVVIFRVMVVLWGFLCIGLGNLHAQVVINEVMFDPAGSEFFDEYIELYNAGDVAVDLTGWRIGDGDDTDGIVGKNKGVILGPGMYALVLDIDYFDRSTLYVPLPVDALILTIDGPTFGNGGLHNSFDERVVLISAGGDTVATMMYRAPNTPGTSEEKVDALGDDAVANWVDAKWEGGTPGRVNSVSVKPVDIALRAVVDSVFVPWTQNDVLELLVVNVGREPVAQFQVHVDGLINAMTLESGFLAVGDSTRLLVDIGAMPGGVYEVVAEGMLVGDEDSHNQIAKWVVLVGYAPGHVVINEVMAVPNLGGEWVELLNVGNDPIDLRGWRLEDARTEGVVVMGEILGRGLVVLSQAGGEAEALALSRWPQLNNGGDVLVLRDVTGALVDSVAYPPASMGVSLERIDALASGTDLANWLGSTKGSTPGQPNSVLAVDVDALNLVADPNPFETETRITYRLPVPRAHVNLWIFDRLGRKVRSLLDADEGGSVREIVWDGRSDHQQFLKPGVFVLYLEARSSDGQVFQSKISVVWARGISN